MVLYLDIPFAGPPPSVRRVAAQGALHTGLPPQVEWPYNLVHEAGSPEAATQALLRKGVAWAL